MPNLSRHSQLALRQATTSLRRLGPNSNASDIFNAINQSKKFGAGFVETYSDVRPWEAIHTAINLPPEFTQSIMERKPYEAQRALDAVSNAAVGRFVWDEHVMSDADWNSIDGYRALKDLGYGHASALKLSTAKIGRHHKNTYIALITLPDVQSISPEEMLVIELLHGEVRASLDRARVHFLLRERLALQIFDEQKSGVLLCTTGLRLVEANVVAHVMAARYAPALGISGKEALLQNFIWRIAGGPANFGDGRRRIYHHIEPCVLEASIHSLHPDVYDLPEDRLLLVWTEVSRDDAPEEVVIRHVKRFGLSPRHEEIAILLLNTGMSSKQIASHLGISTRTVDKHIESLYREFDVQSRSELAMRILRT
ncbi:helix-turn-helix transcriptional regulator [Polyangium sp. 6x1]|uniref:helix-turn-helix transcriptional regulator n=1 Tax=Polyangium sp. 6x1 TaxID=3042689 RepID=UPI0024826D64|nr:helix-turn-helix transcriptional regulator [Polyangium sp. 6x1]MDI1445773.1 helix-turn-helix transcriptional regulator [Polyangium sp. 6x1]